MLRSAPVISFQDAISVASWLKILSPGAVSEYYFTSYNNLVSRLAMQELLDEDFPKPLRAAAGETDTVANLRAAVAEMYPGSTLAISNEQNKLRLAITVPGGDADTWPEQIAKPGPITYPTVGMVPHEVK